MYTKNTTAAHKQAPKNVNRPKPNPMAKTTLIGLLRFRFIVFKNPKHDPAARSTLATNVTTIALTFEVFLGASGGSGVGGGVVIPQLPSLRKTSHSILPKVTNKPMTKTSSERRPAHSSSPAKEASA
jgi:hypothetical protein